MYWPAVGLEEMRGDPRRLVAASARPQLAAKY
jgi:hypothetical protein